MSANLLENFALLAASEGGVAKLRELILSLAVRGKLVPQDPADEPASELLKRIRAEKERLVAEGRIKREKTLPAINEEEKPFDLPEGWTWARWSDFALQIGDVDHKMPQETQTGFPYVSPKDFGPKNTIDFDGAKKISEEEFLSLSSKIRPEIGDLIYPRYGTIGNIRLVQDSRKFLASYSCAIIKTMPKLVDASYQFLCSISGIAEAQAERATNKTTQPNVGLKSIQAYVFPLPPLPEQSRIVAKVEALMALCDRLEAQQGEAARVQAQWTQAALDQLAESGDAAAFARHWQALAEHFDTLFATPASIDALDATLLQLAVRGKLVPQNPADEPASELLKRIRAEKERLVAEGRVKREKTLPAIGEEEKPFDLPEGWEWARLGTLLSKIGAGSTPLGGKEVYTSSGTKFRRSQNIWNDGLRITEVAYIPAETHATMGNTTVQAKDILFNITGASIGRCALVPDDFDEANVSQHVTIIRPATAEIRRYLHLVLVSSHVQQTVVDVQVGVSREGLSIAKLGQFLIPLAPLPEQSRIVAKLDELLALTRTLRTRLTDARALQARLASALVDEVAA